MDTGTVGRRLLGKCTLVVGLSAAGLAMMNNAAAGCGVYGGPAAPPSGWGEPRAATSVLTPAASGSGAEQLVLGNLNVSAQPADIVGLWKFKFVSDGTAYPAVIPAGVVVDFGTVQWHSDGTELTFSGARPPSTGDVCMGIWRKTGRDTYKLNHLALAWISADTPPPLGPVAPAAFVGPATIRQLVRLDRSGNSFEGTFTIDQYAQDELTLLQHIAGKVTATRVTVD